MHFCHEELYAFFAFLASGATFGPWLKSKWYAHREMCKLAKSAHHAFDGMSVEKIEK